jgi:hypothetical protein
VEYLFRAGSQAEARFAYPEAVTRLSSALEFLKHLPDDAERARQELSVQSVLGRALGVAKGFAGGIRTCLCKSARVVRANPRPCSRLQSSLWTMANALVEAGAAHRSGTRRRNSGCGYQHVFFVTDLAAEETGVNGDMHFFLASNELGAVFPIRSTGMVRLIGIVPPEFASRKDLTFEDIS